MNRREQEVACQQVLVEDNSVFSMQSSIIPTPIASGITPESLLERYLAHIRSCTLSFIRPCRSAEGLEFRLAGSRASLISFLPPSREAGALVLRICGGLLVQPRQCERGELRFDVSPAADGVLVSLQLSDYCPLILGSPTPSPVRRWLYHITQAAIHRLVTVRFLVRLYRELAGRSTPVRVVPVSIREGRPV